MTRLIAMLVAIAPWCGAASQQDAATLTTAEETFAATNVTMTQVAGRLVVDFKDGGGKKRSLPADEVVEIVLGGGGGAPPTPGPADVEVVTTAGDVLPGTLGEKSSDGVALASASLGDVTIPFERVDVVRFLANRGTWPASAPSRRAADVAVSTTGNQGLGSIIEIGAGGVVYKSERLKRNITLKLENVSVVWFMPIEKPPAAPEGLYAAVHLAGGGRLRGTVKSLDAGVLALSDFYGKEHRIKTSAIAGLTFKNGRVVYLSDLDLAVPAEENPNYIRAAEPLPSDPSFPYQRDLAAVPVRGQPAPLTIRRQTYRKGLGVHAFSRLTWDLGRSYSTLQAVIGIDDAALDRAPEGGVGNVVFKVVGDGKTLFDSGPVTSKDAPRPISVDVKGVARVELIVDFGSDHSSQGDVADWANARIIR